MFLLFTTYDGNIHLKTTLVQFVTKKFFNIFDIIVTKNKNVYKCMTIHSGIETRCNLFLVSLNPFWH